MPFPVTAFMQLRHKYPYLTVSLLNAHAWADEKVRWLMDLLVKNRWFSATQIWEVLESPL